MSGREGGKKKPLKQPKKQTKDLDEAEFQSSGPCPMLAKVDSDYYVVVGRLDCSLEPQQCSQSYCSVRSAVDHQPLQPVLL
ncbi:hypothetical protein Q9233_006968 [Columba guinea]|nr:hypothetical protein Q9233_006968 [Columba guinea]